MAAIQPLTEVQQAVIVAVGISLFKEYNQTHILSVTNTILETSGRGTITADDLIVNIDNLTRAQAIRLNEDGRWQIMMSEAARPKRPGKNSHLYDATKLKSDSIWLVCSQLLTKHNISYIIEYNCDGNGGSRLPSGQIVSKTLNALSALAHQESKVPPGTSNGGGAAMWEVDLQHHPEAPNQKKKRVIRQYLKDNYDM